MTEIFCHEGKEFDVIVFHSLFVQRLAVDLVTYKSGVDVVFLGKSEAHIFFVVHRHPTLREPMARSFSIPMFGRTLFSNTKSMRIKRGDVDGEVAIRGCGCVNKKCGCVLIVDGWCESGVG